MTLSDDLRAAAAALDGLVLAYELPRAAIDEVFALTVRLNAHADTLDRVVAEMRQMRHTDYLYGAVIELADALTNPEPRT